MITFKTGVPGSGKTLTAVDELRAEFLKEAPRAVFVHGIPDLAIASLPLPVYSFFDAEKGKGIRNRVEVDWSVVPDGALVVIDEAQNIFPLRGSGAAVPGYVSFLNVHRHRGIDIVLITQHPRLIDAAVRKLCGRHQHYRRLFGGRRHVCYEWDHCSENLQSMETATKRFAGFPKRAFELYKSAEIHTKPKAAKPLWLLVPALAVVGLVVVGPRVYGVMHSAMSGKGLGLSLSSEPAAGGAPVSSAVGSGAGRVAVAAAAASAASAVITPWRDDIAGCWVDEEECVCMRQGSRPRRDHGLGRLCVDIAHGRVQVSDARPRPARTEPEAVQQPAPLPVQSGGVPPAVGS